MASSVDTRMMAVVLLVAGRLSSVVHVVARTLPILGVFAQLGCSTEPIENAPPPGREFLGGADLPPTPHNEDVIRHLARFHFSGESLVEDEVKQLDGYLQRPWTVERLAAFSAATLETERRAAAVFLLAASRDPTGLRVVGNALDDREPEVRVTAAWGIVLYWIGEVSGGGNAETVLTKAHEWWQDRKATLQDPQK